jgi:predicted amidophosphoribosyltransferase
MLTLHERFRNVRGALGVRTGYDVRGAHILVVDDIMTTGATASEAARVLKRAGARRVTIAVAGRAMSR